MRSVVLLILAFTSAVAIRHRSQFTRYRSWNSRTYPVWQDGDPRFRNCWSGGEVAFDLKNDAPTLTGAKATFTINLSFPPNQTVLPDGQVVWTRNCTVDGREYQEGQAVYPDQDTEWTGSFPDGTPFTRPANQSRKQHYVFVWKTWGRYWQVADGPSSELTIGTNDVSLGSYNMEVVIYHCRGKDKFIPLGYASTVFTITDQVPFSISLAQVNDVNQDDQNFIQNQAIAFSVALHDPSQYLNNAEISFTWDFGDQSGTLISRERTVTHTYLSVGTFKPQVILMASIPNSCGGATAAAPVDASAAPAVVVMASTPAAGQGDATALDVPASDATPPAASEQPADAAAEEPAAAADSEVLDAAAVPVEQDPTDDAAAAAAAAAGEATEDVAAVETDADAAAEGVATVAPVEAAADEPADAETAAEDEAAVVAATATEIVPVIDAAAASVAPVAAEEGAAAEAADTATVAPVADVAAATAAAEVEAAEAPDAATEAVPAATAAAADNVVALAATEVTPAEEAAPADAEAEVLDTENAAAATVATAGEGTVVPAEAEVEADPAQVALVVAKRQAPELTADCTIYRYGSRAASVDVVQGIESVEIVQVVSMATELEQNAVDVTISCQGSLPSEVCTVISDADCITPVQTICDAASPTPDCQMVLRQFFNDTGVFCLNVSLTNDVSLAVASARVNVAVVSGGSPAGTAATVFGVMVLACVVCCIGLMYRRFKQYQPLREDQGAGSGGAFAVTSVPLLLWNLLSRQSPGESRPLLQGRIV